MGNKYEKYFIFITLLYLMFMTLLIYSSQKEHNNRPLKNVIISIYPSKNEKINRLYSNIIKKAIFQNIGNSIKNRNQLCLSKIENKLDNIPFIKKSQVFVGINGDLNATINISYNNPILKIIEGSKIYYLDENANYSDICFNYIPGSYKLISAKGYFSKGEIKNLLKLVKIINHDKFLKNYIVDIEKNGINKIIFNTKTVKYFSTLECNYKNMENKLNILKIFHQQYVL